MTDAENVDASTNKWNNIGLLVVRDIGH